MSMLASAPRWCHHGRIAITGGLSEVRQSCHLSRLHLGWSQTFRSRCPQVGDVRHGLQYKRAGVQRSSHMRTNATADTVTELPPELQRIVTAFRMVPDAKLKYQQLLVYGKKLSPLPQEDHTEDNKVRGCVSQVWVVPEMKDGKVYWKADSDSALTKGLAALLVQGLSGCTPEEIVRIPPDWIASMGLQQSLTPSRNNGFLNMFRLMQKKSLDLLVQGSAA